MIAQKTHCSKAGQFPSKMPYLGTLLPQLSIDIDRQLLHSLDETDALKDIQAPKYLRQRSPGIKFFVALQFKVELVFVYVN